MPQKRTLSRVCKQCSADFLIEPFRVKQGAGIHCSRACRDAARRGVSKPDPRGLVMNTECGVCGKAFHVRPATLKAGNGRFGSWDCKSSADEAKVTIPDDERDVIYLAGLIDGDGSITVEQHLNPRTGHKAVHCRVSVANTDTALMAWLSATYGGGLHTPGKTRAAHHKPVTDWKVGATQAITLCHRLLPYLKVKRRQAEILIALSALGYERIGTQLGRYVSPEKYAAREVLLAELRACNHRGIAAP